MKLLKIQLIYLTFFMSVSLSYAQKSFTLNGRMADVPGETTVYLNYNGKRDSAQVVKGAFAFKGNLPAPVFAWMSIRKNGIYAPAPFPLYLEPTAMAVTSTDSLGNAVITGGELNQQSKKFMALLQSAQGKATGSATDTRGTAGPEPRGMSDEQRKARFELQKSVARSFIKDNPDALYNVYIIRNLIGPDADITEVNKYFETVSARVRNSELAKGLINELNRLKTIAIGQMAPEFAMADTAGKLVSLNSYRGKYVLLDFWASWCSPCRAENPNLVKNYAIYHPKGLEILGVSLDNNKAAWIKAIAEDQLTWTHVSDLKTGNKAAHLYSINSIPQNCLIDPNGKIIAKNLRGGKLGEMLGLIFK